MSYNFGTPKSATGFTLPTTTTPATPSTVQFNFAGGGGGGDLNSAVGAVPAKPLSLFGTPPGGTAAVPSTSATPSFNLAGAGAPAAATTSSGFALGAPAAASAAPQFSLGTALSSSLTSATSAPSFGFGAAATSTTPSTGFALGALGATPAATTAPLSFGTLTSSATTTAAAAAPAFSLGGLSAVPSLSSTVTTTSISALPATGSLTFAQLEDAINKWTVDLEEQGKVFGNQAKHLNAWDRLLISNGEKILGVSNGIERIKQQQQQLDQELDFVLAQQKELEDCIAPLEKELQDVQISDTDRDQTYRLAENIDAQLKQMSEDLKEIIEHLNESNKAQELSDPVAQIGRILNAHMNSLQWIDRNTSQISAHLDEIAKMHDLNRRSHENIHGA